MLWEERGDDCNRVRIGGVTELLGNPAIKAEKPQAGGLMRTAASLSREELETLLPYRLSEAAILAAKAQVARRKANRAREDWRKASESSLRMLRRARAIGERDGFSGREYSDVMSSAHAQHGYAGTLEKIWRRAERDAGYWERCHKRAKAAEASR